MSHSQQSSKNMKLSGVAMSIANKAQADRVNAKIANRKAGHDIAVERTNKKTILTDAQMLEARALNDFAGWSTKKLCERYGVSADLMRKLLSGVTASKLIASKANLPKDLETL